MPTWGPRARSPCSECPPRPHILSGSSAQRQPSCREDLAERWSVSTLFPYWSRLRQFDGLLVAFALPRPLAFRHQCPRDRKCKATRIVSGHDDFLETIFDKKPGLGCSHRREKPRSVGQILPQSLACLHAVSSVNRAPVEYPSVEVDDGAFSRLSLGRIVSGDSV